METMSKSTVTLLLFICVTTTTTSSDVNYTDQPGLSVRNVTAHYCPFPCTMGNEWTCYPPPCVPPICVFPSKYKPTDCCEICPEGPDCSGPDGVPIRYHHWRIVSGRNCTCLQPPSDATCI